MSWFYGMLGIRTQVLRLALVALGIAGMALAGHGFYIKAWSVVCHRIADMKRLVVALFSVNCTEIQVRVSTGLLSIAAPLASTAH